MFRASLDNTLPVAVKMLKSDCMDSHALQAFINGQCSLCWLPDSACKSCVLTMSCSANAEVQVLHNARCAVMLLLSVLFESYSSLLTCCAGRHPHVVGCRLVHLLNSIILFLMHLWCRCCSWAPSWESMSCSWSRQVLLLQTVLSAVKRSLCELQELMAGDLWNALADPAQQEALRWHNRCAAGCLHQHVSVL